MLTRGSLVGTKEQHLKLNNFGSRRAFLIIFFVAFREIFAAPGGKILKFYFEFWRQLSFTLNTVSDVVFL